MRFENGEWETLSDPDGFLADRYLQNLFMESNNRLWIALYDDLLVTWQNGVINPPALNQDIALKSMNSFHDLCAAPNGDLYFGTGWYVWGDLPRKTSLLKRSGEQWLSYGYDEYQNYVVNDICFDAQGSLYIATGAANSDAAELFAMYGSVCKLCQFGGSGRCRRHLGRNQNGRACGFSPGCLDYLHYNK
jgi:sugar lactone lactonase YvrE